VFKATYASASKFRYITQALAKITDEAPFYATQEMFEACILSPDKTTMIILKIPSIAFEEYEVEGEELFTLPTSDLNKIVRRATRNDLLVFEYEKEKGLLRIGFRNKKTGVERSFYIEARSGALETIEELKLDLSVTARFLADDYKQIIRDLKLAGEEAIFHYKDAKLYILSRTQQREYRGEFVEGNPLSYLSSTVDEAKSAYSVGLLEATLKPIQSTKHVTLYFDTDKPAKIEFEIAGGGYMIYWIVPRVE